MLLRAPALRTTTRLLYTSAPLRSSSPSNPSPKKDSSDKPKSTFTKSTSETAAATNAAPLPFLTTPLGVQKRPTSKKLSWTERHPEWFDRDARMEDRRKM